MAIGNRQSTISSRPGFTIIELLVVIGILLILIALFTAGLKHVTMQAKQRDTKTMLQTAVTMLENYKQATHFNRVFASYTTMAPASVPNTSFALTVSNTQTTFSASITPAFWTQGQEQAPGTESGPTFPTTSITPESLHLTDPTLGNRSAVFGFPSLPPLVSNTEIIMEALLTIPENQTILNNLPPNKIVRDAVTGVPLLLDGFGNPILFVPGGGLVNVWVDPSTYTTLGDPVMTSVSVQPNGWDPTATTGTIYAGQPFFISAGPDGDISNSHGNPTVRPPTSDMTDDNIYSFQN